MGYAHRISDKGAVYFITCTVVKWIDVFTRKLYADIVFDSLNYCVENKGLVIYGYVLMSNHLHMLVQAKEDNLSDLLRDFKKFTSQTTIRAIEDSKNESRRTWMLWLFQLAGSENGNNTRYQFWRPDNQPELCYELKFMWQKLNYLHNNPVAAGLVHKAEEYVYSSAGDYVTGKQVGKVKVVLLDQLQTTYT